MYWTTRVLVYVTYMSYNNSMRIREIGREVGQMCFEARCRIDDVMNAIEKPITSRFRGAPPFTIYAACFALGAIGSSIIFPPLTVPLVITAAVSIGGGHLIDFLRGN